MSEYQCYEFVALDRPLDAKQMAELRAISSRADISATRFWNEYQWGDLKADPTDLLARYFDAHLYFASFGTRRLALRLPRARVDEATLQAYLVSHAASCLERRGAYLVVDFAVERDEPDDDGVPPGSLATLAAVRGELLAGDLRAAYLAWLGAVQDGHVDEDDDEPPVPAGLDALTAAQQALVDFLDLDDDLFAAAITASKPVPDDAHHLRAWVAGLPARQKDAWLRRAVEDPDLPLGAELRRAFRATTASAAGTKRRAVGAILALSEERRAERHRAETERRRRAHATAERERRGRLDALARDVDTAWVRLEGLVQASDYDEALRLATDLRDLATREGDADGFAARFEALRKRQARRRGFFDRWKRAAAEAAR